MYSNPTAFLKRGRYATGNFVFYPPAQPHMNALRLDRGFRKPDPGRGYSRTRPATSNMMHVS